MIYDTVKKLPKQLLANLMVLATTFLMMIGCASIETRLGTNFDVEAVGENDKFMQSGGPIFVNTYEIGLGYNKEDMFNLVAFGNVGLALELESPDFIYGFGLQYEHFFTDTIGIAVKVGWRTKIGEREVPVHGSYGSNWEEFEDKGVIAQLGVPFSWSYGIITPYIGLNFYDSNDNKPKFNLGVSFSLRNQVASKTMGSVIIAPVIYIPIVVPITVVTFGLGAEFAADLAGNIVEALVWNISGPDYFGDRREVAKIITKDNQEIPIEAITDKTRSIVEDRLPYPAWKWRRQYEGIHWEYRDGVIYEL